MPNTAINQETRNQTCTKTIRSPPWYEQTWNMLVRGKLVPVPVTTTIREIKEKLPPKLLNEFNDVIENTEGHLMRHRLAEWGMPLDELLKYRREIAERCYWDVTDSTDYPDDMDVDEIYRTKGGCLTDGSNKWSGTQL